MIRLLSAGLVTMLAGKNTTSRLTLGHAGYFQPTLGFHLHSGTLAFAEIPGCTASQSLSYLVINAWFVINSF